MLRREIEEKSEKYNKIDLFYFIIHLLYHLQTHILRMDYVLATTENDEAGA